MSEETFGQVLRRLRGRRTLQAVANAAGISTSYVHKLENGQGAPTLRVVEALDAATHAHGELIEAYERTETRPAPIAEFRPPIAAMSPVRTLDINDAYCNDEEDATERRRLLQMAAGLGALGPVESLRQLIDLETRTSQSTEDWELACADHLYALCTRAPGDVAHDLHLDLVAVLRQVEQTAAQLGADHKETRDLFRVLAAMSTLNANVLTRSGQHGDALRWWRTARHTADASGDLHLSLGVRSTETGHALSGGQRDPATVLRLIHSADEIVAKAPASYGAALMEVSRAKALSMLGRHDEALTALNDIQDRLETGSLPVSIMPVYWRNQQFIYAQLWVYSAAGVEAQAVEARDKVLADNRDYQYRAIARLHTARCTVVCGGVEEGAAEAVAVLDGVQPAFRTTMVVEAGRMVVRAVPDEQRARPAVGDLRAMLAIES